MNVLVTGGTGTVGSEVVREVAARGANVSVLTRDLARTRNFPASVNLMAGNLQQPETVRKVFNGIDAVFLLNAVSQTESHEALLALCGMRLARPARVVYLSVQDADQAAWLPHFGSKAGVEQALRQSGLAYTILRPNNFYQNDYWLKDAILGGMYPQPLGSVGVSRVDVRDIAEAAAIALLSQGHESETYDLVGPDILTGESVAAAWSRALGKTVRYAGDDLDVWERQSLQHGMPDWMVFDFRMMFEHFQTHGLKAPPGAIERQTRLLGHQPRSFDAFAAETAAVWRGRS